MKIHCFWCLFLYCLTESEFLLIIKSRKGSEFYDQNNRICKSKGRGGKNHNRNQYWCVFGGDKKTRIVN